MSVIGVFFSILSVAYPTYDWDQLFLWQIKPRKRIKSKKLADSGCKLRKLGSNSKMNITKMGKTLKSEFSLFNPDFRENYHKFSNFSVLLVYVIVIFNLNC